jgi:hypothetical protein
MKFALIATILAVGFLCNLPGQTNTPPVNGIAPVDNGSKLVNLHLKSKDRMFLGEIKVVPTWEHTSLRFVNLTTKQDLGTYPDILENMNGAKATVKIYNHQSDMFSDEDLKEAKTNPLITQQKVVFFKDDADSTVLHFASTFDDVGTMRVQIIQDGKVIEYGETKLTRDTDFSALIQATDEAISGPQAASTNQARPVAPPTGG